MSEALVGQLRLYPDVESHRLAWIRLLGRPSSRECVHGRIRRVQGETRNRVVFHNPHDQSHRQRLGGRGGMPCFLSYGDADRGTKTCSLHYSGR